MKTLIVVVLVLLGIYWLTDHYFTPISHESFGLYNHMAHRIIGVVLLVVAGFLTWKWKFKKNKVDVAQQ